MTNAQEILPDSLEEFIYNKKEELGLNDPDTKFLNRYNYINLQKFLNEKLIPYPNPVSSKEKIFIVNTDISQNKLRQAGFNIKRDCFNVDFVLINSDVKKILTNTGYSRYFNNKYYQKWKEVCTIKNSNLNSFIHQLILNPTKTLHYVELETIYRSLYKYVGDRTLYDTLDSLLASKSSSNIQMAMEMMTNANWENNQVYLMMLFNNYKEDIFYSSYRSSINWKGFDSSLEFNFRSINLRDASSFRDYCTTDEHHEFILDYFKDDLQYDLNELKAKHKILIDKLEYSIDKRTFEEIEKEEADAG